MSRPLEAGAASSRLAAPERLLNLYLRVLALAYLAVGIFYWLEILSLPSTPQGALLTLSFEERAETIVFAVLDPIAAVGLWLTASWGVVVWLALAFSRIVIASGLAGDADPNLVEVVIHIIGIAIYVVLWQLARSAAAQREQLG